MGKKTAEVNILPASNIYETSTRMAYYEDEQDVRDQWPVGSVKNNE